MNGRDRLNVLGTSYDNEQLVKDSLVGFRHLPVNRSEWKSVYCQECGRDLTNEGGVVSTSGSVYCDNLGITGANFCLDKEMLAMMKGSAPKKPVGFHSYGPDGVQEAIKAKKLVSFKSPLENMV